MLSSAAIQKIHITKSQAGLSDEQYRSILFELTGARSSKDESLSEHDGQLIISALKQQHLAGWQKGQIQKVMQYCKFCNLTPAQGRELIFRVTGFMSEFSPELKQEHFEMVICELETRLEELINSGLASLPKGLDVKYWRNRAPDRGGITTRQTHEIYSLWSDLKEFISRDKQTYSYLYSMISSVIRSKLGISDLAQLKAYQASKVIDALRLRVDQEKAKLGKEVPF